MAHCGMEHGAAVQHPVCAEEEDEPGSPLERRYPCLATKHGHQGVDHEGRHGEAKDQVRVDVARLVVQVQKRLERVPPRELRPAG